MTGLYTYRISKEDYEKAQENGVESIISDEIREKYIIKSANVAGFNGEYYLTLVKITKG